MRTFKKGDKIVVRDGNNLGRFLLSEGKVEGIVVNAIKDSRTILVKFINKPNHYVTYTVDRNEIISVNLKEKVMFT